MLGARSSGLRTVVERLFQGLTVAVLAALVVVTAIDVVGRYLLNQPLAGAFELTELLMGALIFAALPLVTMHRQHIAVDIFDIYVPTALRRWQEVLVQTASGVIQFVLTWVFLELAAQMKSDGLHTHALQLPLAPVVYFAAAAALVAGVMHLALAGAAAVRRVEVEAG